MINTKMILSEIYKGAYDSFIKKKNSISEDTSSRNSW